jgi:hypothetical protein
MVSDYCAAIEVDSPDGTNALVAGIKERMGWNGRAIRLRNVISLLIAGAHALERGSINADLKYNSQLSFFYISITEKLELKIIPIIRILLTPSTKLWIYYQKLKNQL